MGREQEAPADGNRERILPGSQDEDTMEEVVHEGIVSTSSSSAFSPETLLIVGEVLYILRPAIYAAAMKYFDQQISGQYNDAEEFRSDDGQDEDYKGMEGIGRFMSIQDL